MATPAETRQRIVDTAAGLFSRSGVRGVGINEIWPAAEVAKSTLYQHFRSKDELVAEVLRQRDAQWCARLRSLADAATSPSEALLMVFALLEEDFAVEDYRGNELLNAAAEYPDPTHPVREAIRAHKNHLLEYLTELAVVAGEQDAATTAAIVLTLADGAVCARVVRGDRQAAGRARAAAVRLLA